MNQHRHRTLSYQIALLLGLALMSWHSICAQTINKSHQDTTDFSTRVGFELNKEFSFPLKLQWEEELRLKNNSTTVDRIYSSLSAHYTCWDFMKVGLGYTFQSIWHEGKKKSDYKKYWDLRHRINADLLFNYQYMRWKFTLRERGLCTFRTDDPNSLEKANPKWLLRSKIEAEYKFFSKPLKPYASFEVSNTLNAPSYAQGNYINSLRSQIGLKWRLDRRNSLDFYYRFDVNYDRDIDIDYKKDKTTIKAVDLTYEREFNNIIGVVYCFDWK